jgi:membrane-bound serine protease (ClpP class)
MRRGPLFLLACFAGFAAAATAWNAVTAADDPAAGDAQTAAVLLPLRLPIVGTRDTQVESAILRQIDRLRSRPGQRGVLVLQFVPPGAGAPGEGPPGDGADLVSDFGRSLELARFLTGPRLAGVKTVAFLPEGAVGHAVLVALACEEICMAGDAVLGPANVGELVVDEPMRVAYREIAARRRTVPPAVAVGMLDPAARVARVVTDGGTQFVATDAIAELRQTTAVLEVEELEPAPLAFGGRRGRELGFVRLLAATPADLAAGLRIPERSLTADPSLEGGWRPTLVPLSGAITADAVARTRTRLDRAVAAGSNLLILRIDSAGGVPEQSLVLATWLAGLDSSSVRTVAWVPREARGDAALVALACDELVMQPDAVLGGDGAATIGQRQGESIAAAWRAGVAKPRDRSWSLPAATAVPGLVVSRAVQEGSGRVGYFTAEELAARRDHESWQVTGELGTGPLACDARRAEELGLATHVAAGMRGLRQAYGLADDIALPQPGWAEELLAALASPGLAWVLLLIGGAGLYIELKTPGFGFGGFVALVAFIVYFWSQYLQGTAGWLEVMLFLAGVVCVAAEILVLPGFGVLGLGGGLLVIASLVLASQSFVLPANDYQIRQMQWSLLGILGAAAGTATLGVALRHVLPSTPFLRNVLLEPPRAAEGGLLEEQLENLLGLEGTATTRLAPAGKARIGGSVRDVHADGGLVEPGRVVRVAEIRDGRVYVREI